MTKLRAIIFDIDGTLADNAHRQQWVREKPKNWNAYNKTMHLDKPINPVIDTLNILFDAGLTIILCSGRQDDKREVTEAWLNEHGVEHNILYMRKTNDHRDDCIVKKEMLDEIIKEYEVIAVFDDRAKVVDMWRENGVYCFDCNQERSAF